MRLNSIFICKRALRLLIKTVKGSRVCLLFLFCAAIGIVHSSASASPYTVFQIEAPDNCSLYITSLNSNGVLAGGCLLKDSEGLQFEKIITWSPHTGSREIKSLCDNCYSLGSEGVQINDSNELWALITERLAGSWDLAVAAFLYNLDTDEESLFLVDNVLPPAGAKVRDPEQPLVPIKINRDGVVVGYGNGRGWRLTTFLIDPRSAIASQVRQPRGTVFPTVKMQISGGEVWYNSMQGILPAGAVCSVFRCSILPVERHYGLAFGSNEKGDIVGMLHRLSAHRHRAVVWQRRGRGYQYHFLELTRPTPYPFVSMATDINNRGQIVGFDGTSRINLWNRRRQKGGQVRWVPKDISRIFVKNSAYRPKRAAIRDLRINDCGDIFLQYVNRRGGYKRPHQQVFLYNNNSACERPGLSSF